MLKIVKKSQKSSARAALLSTKNGVVRTPFFMPIATKGSVKAVEPQDLKKIKAEIILSNTYHLYLQPGTQVLQKFNGLHKFMDWPGPILTDSGGYQVFSLSDKTRNNKSLRKITSQGVEFRSFLDGSKHFFSPKKVQQIQDTINSDIKMVLDVCSPYPTTKKKAEKDLNLTHSWAKQALDYHQKKARKSLLFAIIQGSVYKDLRLQSAKYLSSLNFDGYALGGLAVGEENKKMYQVLDYTLPELPQNKPRYLMGVGKPENILQAVKKGIDMFDCVIPTREARHGRLYIFNSKAQEKISQNKKFYQVININNSKFKNNTRAINQTNLNNYSLSYLHHLFKAKEPLALRLATLNNLNFYLELMRIIRRLILNNNL